MKELCVLWLFAYDVMIDTVMPWQKKINIESMRKRAKISPILSILRSPFFRTFKTLWQATTYQQNLQYFPTLEMFFGLQKKLQVHESPVKENY